MASSSNGLIPVKVKRPGAHGHSNLSYARHIKWLGDVVTEWDGSPIDVGVVGVPYNGYSRESYPGGALGPTWVRDALYTRYSTYNVDHDTEISHLRMMDCGDIVIKDSSAKIESYASIEESLSILFASCKTLIMIGGDADATMPIARSLIRQESAKTRIGIVDFDSHYDNRDLEDEFKQGGSDWVRWLMENEPVPIKGKNIVQIGIHGFVYSEFDAKYAKMMGNTVFRPRDVRALGINEVARQTLSKVTDGTDAFYVHFCIDTIDQPFIGGGEYGSFVGGLMPWEFLDSLVEFGKHPLCRGIYICTYNPLADTNILMKTICEIIMQFTTGIAIRLKSE